uniref:Uncharacterized protein n=1 Tax=Picea sitchensis TaxID=3332 RepID=A0A6B9XZK0_PICSI|nr:hypothetical protein Q903MT_gene6954 [Picea sitchensis]
MSRPLSSLSVLRYAKLTEGCFHSEGRKGSESWLDRMGEEAVSVRRSYIMKSITLDWKGALRLLYM